MCRQNHSCLLIQGTRSLCVKTEYEIDHSFPSIAKIKKTWSLCLFTSLCFYDMSTPERNTNGNEVHRVIEGKVEWSCLWWGIHNFRDWCCYLHCNCSSTMQWHIFGVSVQNFTQRVDVPICYILLFGVMYLDWCNFAMGLILFISRKTCNRDFGND
jgi:hypothetical protein